MRKETLKIKKTETARNEKDEALIEKSKKRCVYMIYHLIRPNRNNPRLTHYLRIKQTTTRIIKPN